MVHIEVDTGLDKGGNARTETLMMNLIEGLGKRKNHSDCSTEVYLKTVMEFILLNLFDSVWTISF